MEEESVDMIKISLIDLFDDAHHDLAKRFFYYMISSLDLAHHLSHNHGIELVGQARGDNSMILINRSGVQKLSSKSQTLVDGWRQYKLLCRIICKF